MRSNASGVMMEAVSHRSGGNAPRGVFLNLTYDEEHVPKVWKDTRVWTRVVAEDEAPLRKAHNFVRPVLLKDGSRKFVDRWSDVAGRLTDGTPDRYQAEKRLFYFDVADEGREGPEKINTLRRVDAQLFMKRVRQYVLPGETAEPWKQRLAAERRERLGVVAQRFRWAMCGEYGGRTERPHYHVVLFGFGGCLRDARSDRQDCECDVCRFFTKCWGKGGVAAPCLLDDGAARYVSKYAAKGLLRANDRALFGREPQFFRTSEFFGDEYLEAELPRLRAEHAARCNAAGCSDLPVKADLQLNGEKLLLSRRHWAMVRDAVK